MDDKLLADIEKTLHDYAVSLYEYANGRATGNVYGEQTDKATNAIYNMVLDGKIEEVRYAREYATGDPEWNYLNKRLATLEKLRRLPM